VAASNLCDRAQCVRRPEASYIHSRAAGFRVSCVSFVRSMLISACQHVRAQQHLRAHYQDMSSEQHSRGQLIDCTVLSGARYWFRAWSRAVNSMAHRKLLSGHIHIWIYIYHQGWWWPSAQAAGIWERGGCEALTVSNTH
jgi:hypothetical protein